MGPIEIAKGKNRVRDVGVTRLGRWHWPDAAAQPRRLEVLQSGIGVWRLINQGLQGHMVKQVEHVVFEVLPKLLCDG